MWFKYGLKVNKRVCHKSTARKSVSLTDLQTSITDLYLSTFCLVRACGAYLIRFSLLYFFLRDALAVDGAPGEDDVG